MTGIQSTNSLIQLPTGDWGFVGEVDVRLAFVRKDGSAPTEKQLDIARHCFHFQVPLPEMFSLEIAILLVSVKIIWMIHIQTKVEHFQFWILNSIEFRLNDIAKRIRTIEAQIKD